MGRQSAGLAPGIKFGCLLLAGIFAGALTTYLAIHGGDFSALSTGSVASTKWAPTVQENLFGDDPPAPAQVQAPAPVKTPSAQAPVPQPGTGVVAPAAGKEDFAAQMLLARDYIKGMHQQTADSPITPEGYAAMAKLRQQIYCRDSFPPNFEHAKITPGIAGPNTTMYQIDPKPVYMTLYSGTSDIVSGFFLRDGYWEKGDQAEILWALNAPLPASAKSTSTLGPALFVDVGTNLGAFTFNMAGKGFEVISFEAMNGNQRMLRTSMCASHPSVMDLVTLHAFALGAKRDQCFMLANFNWGNGVPVCNASSPQDALQKYGNVGGTTYTVRDQMIVERLDDALRRDVKVMKIDVEGFEPMVVEGMMKLLTQHHVWYIVMEINKETLTASLRGTNKKIYQHILDMQSIGYRVGYNFHGPWLSPQDIVTMGETPAMCPLCNIYFVHKDAL